MNLKICSFMAILFALGVLSPHVAFGQNFLELSGLSPDTQYKTFDTEHFHFIYQNGYFDFTEKAAIHYEHAHEVLSPILKWQPRNKTTVVIADNDDAANGFTLPSLRVGMVLIATPPDAWFSTSYTEDWIKLLVFHEYTHFLNIDPTTEWMETLRILFGDVIRPNGLWPTWMLEGLAVYYETRTSKLGRGRSPYYDGILRAFLNEDRLDGGAKNSITLDRVNGEYPYFPGGEIPYLFGYQLWNQFSKDHTHYSDTDAAMGDLSLRSSSRVPYFIEGNLQNVMGKNWSDYWNSFLHETRERLGNQIEAIKKAGETPFTIVAKSDYSAIGGSISPDGVWLAYTESSMQDRSRLVLLNLKTGEKKKLDEKLLGVGLAFTPDSRFLIYSALTRNDSYHLYSDLFAYSLEREESQEITFGLRAKDPALSPDGKRLVYMRSALGSHFLETADLRIEGNHVKIENAELLFKPKAFSILSSPCFLGQDDIVFSDQELGAGHADLKRTSIQSKLTQTLLSDGFMNRYPTAQNGKIYFVSNQTGVENIHVLDHEKSKPVSNLLTNAAFPFLSKNGELYADILSSEGYQIARLGSTSSIAKLNSSAIKPDAPETIPEALNEPKTQITTDRVVPYTPWSSMLPRQWAPIAYATYDSISGGSFGGFLLGFDSTGKHQYSLAAAYNTLPKTLDATLHYTLSTFRTIIDFTVDSGTSNIATDSGHNQFRTSTSEVLSLSYPILWVRSSLRPSLYLFSTKDHVRRLSDGTIVPVSDFQYSNAFVPGFGTILNFSDARRTRLSFLPELGNELKLQIEDKLDTEKNTSLIKYLMTWSHFFGLGDNSVIQSQLRWLGATRSPQSSLSTSKLVGKGTNNLFDRGTGTSLSQMNFRGYADFSSSIRSVGAAGLDYHFPLLRSYTGLGGTLPAFLKQTHGFVFAETAFVPRKYNPDLFLPSFGGGLSAETTLLIRAPIRFNLEFQNGTRKDYGGESSLFFSIESDSLF